MEASSSTEAQSPQPLTQTPQRFCRVGWNTGDCFSTTDFPCGTIAFASGCGTVGIVDTNPVDPLWISARRLSRLNRWVLAPEKGISNIEVSCSMVGLRAATTKLSGSGSSRATGGSGVGITSIMGGIGFGLCPGAVATQT